MATKCITPFYKKDDAFTPLPCGKCPGCITKRVSNWSVRLLKEGERSSSSLFVTLTYDTRTVPITPIGRMTVSKHDLQKFFKRLRKKHKKTDGNNIRYYAAAEYGSTYYRPHYHIILFNSNYNNVMEAWSIDKIPIGTIHFGTVSEASIGYSLKYISKPSKIPQYRNDDRLPEFALMSRRLGDNYLTPQKIHWHHADLDNRAYIPLPDGKKAPIPRFFKDKIYNSEQAGWLKGVLEKKNQEKLEKQIRADKGQHEWKQLQHHLASFKQLHKNSKDHGNF